jgi:dUTP pyrophosphatase
MENVVEVKILNPLVGREIPLPEYATAGSAGMDLRACIEEPLSLEAGSTHIIPTGLALNIRDPGLMALLAPRSGLGIRHGIVLANLVGIIDSDYHGEILVGLWNRGQETFIVHPGDRICQMIFMPVTQVELHIVEAFSSSSERGEGGLGHTGI